MHHPGRAHTLAIYAARYNMNTTQQGVAIAYAYWSVFSDAFIVMDRSNGNQIYVGAPLYFSPFIPRSLKLGEVHGNISEGRFYFSADCPEKNCGRPAK
jgi:hypothetical protein